ncbi:putative inactive leucine-rich repeat receptor-like protein kinase [Apostasia shenzhenica]|uniref:non-specific serine/threonine protein kinase n=1 Tax=Apostasia shenzhenica TaxID=1088818 RepID=A0A2I0AQF0_9ASPA|nr:putative inactive leucine-rich repeat receptor-like protein kinase [Apostasia shenzhenica]
MRRLSSPFLFPFSLLTSAITITILNAVATSAVSPDGLALLAFKSAVSGDPESALASWDEDDADPCRWPGISCANLSSSPDPRVVGIAVSGKNLSGYIPSELGSLVFLRRLNLHGNRLSGPIPSQLFNASSLHSLFLYDNNLSGPLPPSLCDPPRLQNLDLSRNSLSGNLPVQIRGCRQIQRLILAENRFSGEISAGIWPEMVGLIQIDLSSNNFDGPLPPDIGELDSLTGTLNLSHNSFSGSIPKSLGNLPPAVSLDLRYNNLSGEIPQSGSLANQGPTAFLNNPALCGFPLQIPCQGTISAGSAAPPGNRGEAPEADSSPSRKKGLRPGLIVLISMTDAAGVALIGLILVYVYWKLKDKERKNGCSCTGKSKLGGGKMDKGQWRCRFCCKGTEASENDDDDDDENDSGSAGNEAGEGRLVAMDRAFEFELDELLRASAYVLGKGGLGIVYKVVLGNGVPVAVRRLGEGGGQRYKEFAGEVQAISKVRHPNVVRLRAYYWAQDEKLLISDFIPNGNLAAALRGRSTNPSLSWSIRLKIAKGSARGLVHLHECSPRKFVHGDIKPSNILLDNDFNPYISDFGLNRLMSIAASTNPHDATPAAPGGFIGAALPSSAAATPRPAVDRPNPYRAPESRFPSARPTQKWDVFSLGVVLLEMLTGRQPETAATHVAAGSSAASTSCCSTEEKGAWPELVRWVRMGFEDARPLAEMVDPVLLREVQAKKEVVAAFHVALACTEPDPEARPRMKTLSDNLDRIGQ